MKEREADAGVCTYEFGFTDCGVGSILEKTNEGRYTLTFDDDGDKVVIAHMERWQLELLQEQLTEQLSEEWEETDNE